MPSRRLASGRETFLPIARKIRIAPRKNRQNARVNGGMFWRLILNIAEAAPQMMLAIISAKKAFWTVVSFIKHEYLLVLHMAMKYGI